MKMSAHSQHYTKMYASTTLYLTTSVSCPGKPDEVKNFIARGCLRDRQSALCVAPALVGRRSEKGDAFDPELLVGGVNILNTRGPRSPRDPASIFSALTWVPNRSADPSGESNIKYNSSSRRKLAELASLP